MSSEKIDAINSEKTVYQSFDDQVPVIQIPESGWLAKSAEEKSNEFSRGVSLQRELGADKASPTGFSPADFEQNNSHHSSDGVVSIALHESESTVTKDNTPASFFGRLFFGTSHETITTDDDFEEKQACCVIS